MFKKFLVCCCAFATLLCISLATVLNKDYTFVNADGVVVDIELSNVKDAYLQNDVLTGLTEKITVKYPDSDGEEYTAVDGTIFYPNDLSYSIVDGKNYDLSMTGEYSIRYYYNSSSINFVAEKNFVVSNDYYNIVGRGGEIVLSDENNKLLYKQGDKDSEGLILNMQSGNKFVYNKVVDIYDVNNSTDNDGLKELIKINPLNMVGVDVNNTPNDTNDDRYDYLSKFTYIRITDCYDATNYFEVRLFRSPIYGGGGWLMVNAGTPNIPFTCMFPTDKPVGTKNVEGKVVKYNNANYFMYVNRDDLGAAGYGSLYSSGILKVKFNPETNCIYVANHYNNKMILDLDSAEVHGDNNVFKGFTTGEVYISVYNDSYYAQTSTLEIYSIDGVDGQTLKNHKLNNESYSDTVAPKLDLNAYLTTEDGFYAALNEKVYIPDAKAMDVNLKGDVEVSVVYDLDDNGGCKTAYIHSDEKGKYFITNNESEYVIKYTAVDKFNNKTIKQLKVQVNTLINGKSIGFGSINNFRTDFLDSEKLTDAEFKSGEVMTLKPITFCTLNRDLTCTVKAIHDKEVVDIPADGKFIASYQGEYEIVYTLKDNVSTYVYSYKVNATPSQTAVNFVNVGNVDINKYIIFNQTYGLKDVKATKFNTGVPVLVDADVYLLYYNANGEYISTSEKKKAVNCKIDYVENAKYVVVRYQVGEGENAPYVDTNMATLVDVGYGGNIIKHKYFQGDFTVQETNLETGKPLRDIRYESNVNTGSNTLEFINPVYVKKFSLGYKINNEDANFSTIDLDFVDVIDSSKKLNIKITQEGKDYYVYVNGGEKTWLKGFIFSGKNVTVSYDYAYRRLKVADTIITLDLAEFNKCYFSLTISNILDKSAIIISQVCNQGFLGNNFKDLVEPISVVERSLGQFDMGDIVEIYHPEFFDILDQVDYSTYSLTITHAEGKPVLDENGNEISKFTNFDKSVKVKVDNYGKYFVKTAIKDVHGNEFTESYYFEGIDLVAPVIKLGNKLNENSVVRVKVGQKVTFSYTATDNYTPQDKIAILIQLYEVNHRYNVNAEQGKDYIYIRHRGTFQVRISAEDEEGNFSTATYTLISE